MTAALLVYMKYRFVLTSGELCTTHQRISQTHQRLVIYHTALIPGFDPYT